ncbi:uncharacterized protein PHACADRAFT_201795 [Phanerochaete carnosa HHB-10118-sp]|uniref:Uncharacterized protein n=1 Tax=Phanerochaete carnosa (strain HHB-10118-sp) TaxID=650164 RepID=K5VRY9_PHACS|nr:uncharacterized protein PHACADRAFT_201795 [Phanerochaete carnosa HHB-10118-sp]EKM49309.1 hypothetical protein PHACADRAFT_201795 [Phanerochaete carnosa HHB-10118-sp]
MVRVYSTTPRAGDAKRRKIFAQRTAQSSTHTAEGVANQVVFGPPGRWSNHLRFVALMSRKHFAL